MTPTAFSRSFARLLAERRRSTAGTLVCGGVLLVLWGWWASQVEVTLYEVAAAARVERDASTHPVQAPLPGRVVSVHLAVGQAVRRGDILVELDAGPEQLHLRQEQVRTTGIALELQRLESEVAAETRVRSHERQASGERGEEAAGRLREAAARVRQAEQDLARADTLHRRGLVPLRELDQARTEAERLRAALTTLESAARSVPLEQGTRDRERDVRIERLRSQMAALEAQRRTFVAGIERLTHEIERRRLRAPVDGTIAEAAVLHPGAVLREGEPLASIMPAGQLAVAAQFRAGAALGRIRRGQPATLRLDGFPWAEFGSVSATVTRVAQETRNGTVRVELAVDPHSTFRGPLEHGMPGSLEIVVERLTPLALVLRTAGRSLAGGR